MSYYNNNPYGHPGHNGYSNYPPSNGYGTGGYPPAAYPPPGGYPPLGGYPPSSYQHHAGHGTGFGTLLAGGAAAAAAAYGSRHHGYGALGYHNGGGYHGHYGNHGYYGHHGKFKHGKFKGKHYGGHKFKKWK